jgi:hypothetical protein
VSSSRLLIRFCCRSQANQRSMQTNRMRIVVIGSSWLGIVAKEGELAGHTIPKLPGTDPLPVKAG